MNTLSCALFARAMLLTGAAFYVSVFDDYHTSYYLTLLAMMLTVFYIEDAKVKRHSRP